MKSFMFHSGWPTLPETPGNGFHLCKNVLPWEPLKNNRKPFLLETP